MSIRPEITKYFAKLILDELGIVYQETNFYQLESRLQQISSELNVSVEELYQQAQRTLPPRAKSLLLDHATNNETSFFRDPEAFEAIREVAIRKQEVRGRSEAFKIWCAACSSGQEVYSLAIMLESCKQDLPSAGYQIRATDISDRILECAKKGEFSDIQMQRGLTPSQREQYFRKTSGGQWKIKETYQKHITFGKLNLLDLSFGMSGLDLILCRNVLIYQTVDSKKQIIERLHRCLAPGGYLVLGGAESLVNLSNNFDMVQHKSGILFQKQESTALKAG